MAAMLGPSEGEIPSLRIALCQGRDISVNLPDGRQDWVGDSARRASRAVQHCDPKTSEILVQDAIISAFSLARDFELSPANIEMRANYEKHKKEEPLTLFVLNGINTDAAADAEVSPSMFTLSEPLAKAPQRR